ncbi:tyrosine-protein phosphatase [Janibacter sp. G56]|uniref:tyrosine-protein phosphatase n=1 Tax=Janibacter sp. G56 TaxID=3418717 RepID=UPI003D052AC4
MDAHSGWITLDGVVNMRDLGGLPTRDGGRIAPRRLIRSDNLQDLSETDVRHLVTELGISDVIDLRSHTERTLTGPGPLTETDLTHHHHSFLRDDVREVTAQEALAMPWVNTQHGADRSEENYWAEHYLGYLAHRPDSVAGALDVISRSTGGAVVHCAAGKDRTGTVVALALAVAGVPDEVIIEDYTRTAERIEQIIERLRDVEPYRAGLVGRSIDEQTPQPETMERILGALDARHGGAAGWLVEQGWDEGDLERLRVRLTV